MKRIIIIIILIIIALFAIGSVYGASLRERINKQKVTLVTVQSIEQAKAQAQEIVNEDTAFIKNRLGITKFTAPKSQKLFDVSLAKFSRTFTVLIPKGQKKSFGQFERPIQFNQSTVFILDTVDLDKNVGFITFSVTPDKEILKKLIDQHNAKFEKPKEDKKEDKKSKSNPFGVNYEKN